jgi:hypothetical protein
MECVPEQHGGYQGQREQQIAGHAAPDDRWYCPQTRILHGVKGKR